MNPWSLSDLIPGLWLAALVAVGWIALRRWYDAPPGWFVAVTAALVLGWFGPGLMGGARMLGESELPGIEDALPHNELTLRTLPTLAVVGRALKAGEWPLWNPHGGLGLPLLGDPVAQPFEPLVWSLAPLSLAGRAAAVPALRVVVALFFTFLFLRRLSMGPGAAALGAGGYLVLAGVMGPSWPTASVAAWLPVLLYAVLRADQGEGRRDLLLLGGGGAAFLLSGDVPAMVWGLFFAGAFAGVRLARPTRPRAARLRTASRWGAAALLGALLVSPVVVARQSVVTAGFPWAVAHGERLKGMWNDPFGLATWGDLAGLAGWADPGDEGRGVAWWQGVRDSLGEVGGGQGGAGAVLGLGSALGLLAFWVAGRLRRRGPPFAGEGVAVFFLLGLPPLFLLPGVAVLVRGALALPTLGLADGVAVFALCAGWGMARWVGWLGAVRRPVPRWLGGGLLSALLAFALVEAGARVPQATAPAAPADALYPSNPALAELQRLVVAHPGFRLMGDGVLLPPQVAAVHGLPDGRLDRRGIPRDVQWLIGTVLRSARPKSTLAPVIDEPLLDLMGVRWVLAPPGRVLAAPLVFQDPTGWIYERPAALPSELLPARAEAIGDDGWRQWVRSNQDFSARALVDRLPDGKTRGRWRAGAAAARVEVKAWGTTSLEARYEAGETRLLTAALYQDGGWRVLVDGVARRGVRANGALVGAWLPSGVHRLDLLYRPPYLGLTALLAGLALAAAVAWGPRWEPRP